MPCPCETYIRILANPCDDVLILQGVIADETDTWLAVIEYNGLPKCSILVDVISGQPVELPNVLNEYYTHELRLYRANGDLVGCYWIGGPFLSQELVCGNILSELRDPMISEFGYKLIIEHG